MEKEVVIVVPPIMREVRVHSRMPIIHVPPINRVVIVPPRK